eukprot:2989120-Alexandrium_andersonii.AAC.1
MFAIVSIVADRGYLESAGEGEVTRDSVLLASERQDEKDKDASAKFESSDKEVCKFVYDFIAE